MSDRCSQVLDQVHGVILRLVQGLAAHGAAGPRRLLDVGCWDGAATARYAEAFGASASGIEIFEGPASHARARGVEVASLDLETGSFPWPAGHFDLAIANQVFEHLKNVWRPMSEIVRVLKPGGSLVLSVPNLASFHNRAMLALGLQPSSIRTRGPHVRGFTAREARGFVGLDGALEDVRLRGVGFYPLPARWAGPLAALWPGGSHTIVVIGRKRPESRDPWREVMEREMAGQQTHFG